MIKTILQVRNKRIDTIHDTINIGFPFWEGFERVAPLSLEK